MTPIVFYLRPEDAGKEAGPLNNLMAWLFNRDHEKTWKVTVSEDKESRSDKQNRLQWMWHGEWAKHYGETKDQAYNRFKYRHCRPIMLADPDPKFDALRYIWGIVRDDKEGQAAVTKLLHTGDLSVAQMADALTEYEQFAGAQGCVFTDPEDLKLAAIGKA